MASCTESFSDTKFVYCANFAKYRLISDDIVLESLEFHKTASAVVFASFVRIFPFYPAHSFCYTVLGCIPFFID